ncbi:MAG: hypothetical protein FWF53_12965 [Candidatus Azobacteroides sp.]|nr:hypothetical protein [Candidatus Azobacteroides sp.]
MKKTLLILGTSVLLINSYGQAVVNGTTETEILVPLQQPIPKDDGLELLVPQKTMSSRTITIEVIDTVSVNADIFYYSPRMENKTYPFWEELGQRDNYIGTTDYNNQCKIIIPDTCEQGTKIMVRTIGYEPLDININCIQNESSISVRLTPQIYNCTIMLEKVEYPFNWRGNFIKPIITDEIKPQTQSYYADCSPIYYKNGNRAYNGCVFTIFYYYPKLWIVHIDDYSLKEMYKELKKGKNCNVLLYVNRSGMVDTVKVEGFSNKKKLYYIQQNMQNSKWRFDPYNPYRTSNNFQYCVHFVSHW